jgi:hypothetical protein
MTTRNNNKTELLPLQATTKATFCWKHKLKLYDACEIDRIAGSQGERKLRLMKTSNHHWQQVKQGARTIPGTCTVREAKTNRSSKNPLKFRVATKNL